MTVPWTMIGEILKAAVPSIIAAIVAWVAVQNWITAKNKLALDLFDRRHTIWREITEAHSAIMLELIGQKHDLAPFEVTPGLSSLGKAKERAFFLFGPDVMKPLSELEMLLFHSFDRPSFVSENALDGVSDEFIRSRKTMAAWEALQKAIVPYMMLSHIAVSRPSTRSRVKRLKTA
jgi:hypothetical protein